MATIQVTTIELVIEKLKKRTTSSAFCDRPCSFPSGVTGAGSSSDDTAEAIRKSLSAAKVRLTLRLMNAAARSSTTSLILNLSKISTPLEIQVGPKLELRKS